MRFLKNLIAFVCVWGITTLAIALMLVFTTETGSDGNAILNDAELFALVFVPLICGALTVITRNDRAKKGKYVPGFSLPGKIEAKHSDAQEKKKSKKLSNAVYGNSFTVPKSKKQQTELGDQLLAHSERMLSFAYDEDKIGLFVDFYELAISDLQKASQLGKASFGYVSPDFKCRKLQEEYQLHLCDAIVRAKRAVIQDIKGKYINSREFQEKALSDFTDELDSLRPKFSPGTAEVADEAIASVQAVLNSNCAKAKPLSSIDDMSGEEFEAWCAELLRRLDYKNIELTPTTGDQGVDIIAEKNDVKYAFQCKCYATDLGNKPIQEVNSGKAFYHCHVGVVMTNRYFTQGGQDAAEATSTLLWDRDKVFGMAKDAGML